MERSEWVTRFASKLHAQWPRIPCNQIEEVARELLDSPWWREHWLGMGPEAAADDWLAYGRHVDAEERPRTHAATAG